MFAAASDADNTSLIDLLAVKRGHGIMCFDAVAALGQAPETELIFIEAPEAHRAVIVEGLYPTPHIHEQIMATTTATLSTMR